MMAADSIFICHAHSDAAFAQDLGLALETCRLEVWRDARHLRGGDRLFPEVRWAIEQARQVIVVLSLNTGDPAWLRREIELAQETERRRTDAYRVIPVLLPGTDPDLLDRWFTPKPWVAAILVTTEGLGATLPALLSALGQPPLHRGTTEHTGPPLAELELTFGSADSPTTDAWWLTARLSLHPEPISTTQARISNRMPHPPAPRFWRWYWRDYLLWPTDTLRQFANRVETTVEDWGRALYQATLAAPDLRTLTAAWRDAPESHERRLVVRADAANPATAAVLDLPWELLHDETDFLIRKQRPIRIQRRLLGGGDGISPAPPPLRILTISPRPDTEPMGHPDARRSALPLLEALEGLGGLVEPRILVPPTLAALEKQLNDAWSAGRPFTALHLDGHFLTDPDTGALLFGFEASYDLRAPVCRDAHFIPLPALESLLATYRIRLVTLVHPGQATGSATVAGLASTLLAAGIAAVLIVHPDAPAETLRRFWSAFYEELLRGSRVSQAAFAGQRRLAGDSYRALGLGGGGVYLWDWSTCTLYLGRQDPQFVLRPPLDLWRRLLKSSRTGSLGRLPEPPRTGFIGRDRELLIIERLFENQLNVFVQGTGGSGKTTVGIALARWLGLCGRYRHVAYLRHSDADDLRTLLEALGRQLLPKGDPWSVDRYPTLWQATDALRQTLRSQTTLVVLDQLDQWPSEQDESMEQFWKQLTDSWAELHLLALGRLGPPAFIRPWTEIRLIGLDERDAIALLGQTLIAAGEMPPITDSGSGFQPLRELVTLTNGHPGGLRRLAREISVHGVDATLATLGALRTELLSVHGDDPQWSLYLSLELGLRGLAAHDRESLNVLAFFKYGASRIALGSALTLDTGAVDQLCTKLITLELAEDQGYGHLRFDAALSRHLDARLTPSLHAIWRERWRTGMEQLLGILYLQHFKDPTRATRLLKLELPNLLALLRDYQQHATPEHIAQLAGRLEPLLTHSGAASALAEVVAARERASQSLLGWSRIRFEAEQLRIERLRDEGSLEEALDAARQLLHQLQEAGTDAYSGAAYDLGRAYLQLGKLLKLAGAAEPAIRELTEARQRFQALADAGNVSAGRMAAITDAETGDCLTDLRRLQDAAAAYQAALAHVDPQTVNPTVAAHQMQLGLVRQRQGHYSEAAALYDAARRLFEMLSEPEGTAQAWRQLGVAHKLNGQMEPALQACQRALYLYEQQRHRGGIAETLGELGHLHQVLNQLEEAALAYRRMADLYAQLGDGRSEEASRNKLANALIQLRRPDEARQELYRAGECNPPESPTARNWAIRRGLRDVGQAVDNPDVADQARRQAIQKYLAYRRAGGENASPGARLCARVGQAIRSGDAGELAAKLDQIAANPNVPTDGKRLIVKLQTILAGARDPTLATDSELHYQYAAEIQLLLEELART